MSLQFFIVQYLSLGITLGVCAFLFATLRRDLRLFETGSLRNGEALRTRVKELAEELETVRRELAIMGQKSDPRATVARTFGAGVRIQALRMIKDGEGPLNIAGALGLPRNEAELLVKVQRLLAEQEPQPTA